MHNIDRTLQELENPLLPGEFENGYEYGSQGEYAQELEFGQEYSQEYSPESYENQQELEMAYQLLEVSTEQELSQFLGTLIGKAAGSVAGAASRFAASPAGRSVGQYLVDFGKKTLPQLAGQYGAQAGNQLGAAVGGRLGGAGAQLGRWAGTQAGDWLANNAQRVFNLELAGLNPESQALEIAKSYVGFATDVAKRAQQTVLQQPHLSPAQLGRQVLSAAVPRHAPGLLPASSSPAPAGAAPATRGTWVRQGNSVILYNV